MYNKQEEYFSGLQSLSSFKIFFNEAGAILQHCSRNLAWTANESAAKAEIVGNTDDCEERMEIGGLKWGA